MKKTLFIGVAALAMLASCSNDEVVEQPKSNAISFSTFVDNATRADALTAENLAEKGGFGVYGYVENMNGKLFDNEKVTKGESAWTYSNKQYWVAGKSYWFQAFAPYAADYTFTAPTGNLPTGEAGTVSFTNNGTTDFCVAFATATGQASGNAPVPFTFKHLLSRVKFTFANSFSNDNMSMVVSNVKITNAHNSGTMDLGANTWTVGETNTLAIPYTVAGTNVAREANVASDYNFLIPNNYAYTVTFTVKVYTGSTLMKSKDFTVTLPATNFQRGYSYNFTATLNAKNTLDDLEPIEFTVAGVDGWGTDNAGTVTIPEI